MPLMHCTPLVGGLDNEFQTLSQFSLMQDLSPPSTLDDKDVKAVDKTRIIITKTFLFYIGRL